ncbi:unnamed protein product [Calicophoron daubneyi]|uniref:DH domain-containing protein n=2 Tax=Calicophoron daubneyi TaxID=300641 RepID=A0AAV2T2G4_CALDB
MLVDYRPNLIQSTANNEDEDGYWRKPPNLRSPRWIRQFPGRQRSYGDIRSLRSSSATFSRISKASSYSQSRNHPSVTDLRRRAVSSERSSCISPGSSSLFQRRSLPRASRKMNKRAHLIHELVETQAKFALDMEELDRAFKKNSTRLIAEDKYLLLGNLTEVAELSSQINDSWQEEYTRYPLTEVDGAVIAAKTLPFKDRINDVFFTYNSNYDAGAVRKHAEMEAYVDEGLENLKLTKPNVLNISSELIKPVQRMFKFIQLFEKLQEHTPESHEDYQATTEMYESFAALARRVNEKKRWCEIRNEVFGGTTQKPNRSIILDMKSFPGLMNSLRLLKKPAQLEIDRLIEEEKNRLQKLQNIITSVREWIRRWVDCTSKAYYSERNFLQCVLNMCDNERHLCIHPLVKSCSQSYAVPVDEINAYVAVVDSCLADLKRVYEPGLRRVADRLGQLLEITNDPQLLLEKLYSVHQELKTTVRKLDEQNYANQSEAALVEAHEELQHTKNTLQENLRKELPVLNKQIENVLFAAVSYVQVVTAKMTSREVLSMRKVMEKARQSPAGKPTLDLVEWRKFVEHIRARVTNSQSQVASIPNAGGASRISRSSSAARSGRDSSEKQT